MPNEYDIKFSDNMSELLQNEKYKRILNSENGEGRTGMQFYDEC